MSPHERTFRQRLADWAPYIAVLNLILFIAVGAVATVAAVNSVKISTLEHRDRQAAMGACVRLKIQRTQINRIALLAYTAFSQGAARERRLAQQPGPAQKAHARSARQTQHAADGLRWTPQTDCRRAVDDPQNYKPPAPRPFKRSQRSVP
jgi:hypothetical protein